MIKSLSAGKPMTVPAPLMWLVLLANKSDQNKLYKLRCDGTKQVASREGSSQGRCAKREARANGFRSVIQYIIEMCRTKRRLRT